jgi:hypothetical protein
MLMCPSSPEPGNGVAPPREMSVPLMPIRMQLPTPSEESFQQATALVLVTFATAR